MPAEAPFVNTPSDSGPDPAGFGIGGPVPDDETPESEQPDGLPTGPGPLCAPDTTPLQKAEYPGAKRFVPASAQNYLPWDECTPRPVARIVIHITDGRQRIGGPISHFQNPASQVSAHYIIGQDGEVVQMVRHDDIAWHAHLANADSIGIEHVARSPRELQPDDPGLPLTRAQYRASASLVRWLCQLYQLSLDRDHILGHSEADPTTTHKDCPNRIWNWHTYMPLLTGT